MEKATLAALREIEAGLVRAVPAGPGGRVRRRVGPFLATADPESAVFWMSQTYIVPPVAGERSPEELSDEELAAAIAELRAFYREQRRRMRFEVFEPLYPALGPRLEKLGVPLRERLPLMLCMPGELRAVLTPGLEIEWHRPGASDESVRQ